MRSSKSNIVNGNNEHEEASDRCCNHKHRRAIYHVCFVTFVLKEGETTPRGISASRLARNKIPKCLPYKICRSTDCINYLLPNKRPIELLNRLRQPNTLPGILGETNRFHRSFIPYAIRHYQWCFIAPVELLMFFLISSHCIILYINPAILLPNNNKRMYTCMYTPMFSVSNFSMVLSIKLPDETGS